MRQLENGICKKKPLAPGLQTERKKVGACYWFAHYGGVNVKNEKTKEEENDDDDEEERGGADGGGRQGVVAGRWQSAARVLNVEQARDFAQRQSSEYVCQLQWVGVCPSSLQQRLWLKIRLEDVSFMKVQRLREVGDGVQRSCSLLRPVCYHHHCHPRRVWQDTWRVLVQRARRAAVRRDSFPQTLALVTAAAQDLAEAQGHAALDRGRRRQAPFQSGWRESSPQSPKGVSVYGKDEVETWHLALGNSARVSSGQERGRRDRESV